jgi:hypothetical protein
MTNRSDSTVATFSEPTRDAVARMRRMAAEALRRMYLPRENLFAFRLRRTPAGIRPEGISRRYTAMVLLGLRESPDVEAEKITQGKHLHGLGDRLLGEVADMTNPGDVAISLWAARAIGHAGAARALDRLKAMDPINGHFETVWLGWALSALSAGGILPGEESLARATADRLLRSFKPAAGLFPHRPAGVRPSRWRAHVADFADQVYPIQGLSLYALAGGSAEAAAAARRCAEQICRLQGPGGQWWWHYDVRTGDVLEKYPVYSVHQDAMGPMALFAVRKATALDVRPAVERSIQWMVKPPEIPFSLIDDESSLIWRKVARREPNRLSRALQAGVSRIHPGLSVPAVDRGLGVPPLPHGMDIVRMAGKRLHAINIGDCFG